MRVSKGCDHAIYELQVVFDQGQVTYGFALHIEETVSNKSESGDQGLVAKKYYGNTWESIMDDQYIVYIQGGTNKLVFEGQNDSFYEEVEIPDKYLNQLIDEHNSHLYWEVIGSGVAITYYPIKDVYADGLAYYSFVDKTFTEIELPIKSRIDLYENEVFVEDYYSYKLNIDTFEFEIYHDKEDVMYEYDVVLNHNILYEDIFYYDDDEWVLYEAEESILNNPDFLPYSEMPVITYKDEEVEIYNSVKFEGINYAQIVYEDLLGTVENNVFEPLVNISVRCFDIDEKGMTYSGFGDEAKAYYYDYASKAEYVIPMDTVVDDVTLIKDYIYVLINGKDILRYNRNEIIKNVDPLSIEKIDLTKMPAYVGDPQFRIRDNDDVLVATVDNYGYYNNKPFKTYVFDQNLELEHEINGEFRLFTADNKLIFRAYPYFVQCDLGTYKHEVIRLGSFDGIIGYHNNYLVYNNAYEGPGFTWIESMDAETLDYQVSDEDYTIMIHSLHQNMFVLHNHIDDKVDYIFCSWNHYGLELSESGITLNEGGKEIFIPFPQNGISVVEWGPGL